jgi:hypothetical protein
MLSVRVWFRYVHRNNYFDLRFRKSITPCISLAAFKPSFLYAHTSQCALIIVIVTLLVPTIQLNLPLRTVDRAEVRPADSEKVWPQSTDGQLADLCDEQGDGQTEHEYAVDGGHGPRRAATAHRHERSRTCFAAARDRRTSISEAGRDAIVGRIATGRR